MAKGKLKNLTNRKQDYSSSSERSTPTSPCPGYPKTPKKLDPDLKAYLMMMVEDIKKVSWFSSYYKITALAQW